MIELGSKVKDRTTGFSGIATARVEYLYSTPCVLVESTRLDVDDKTESKWRWIDEARLVVDQVS